MPHLCHFPGCQKSVPPKLWGCKPHWFMLPKYLRDWIWREYRPGQETDKRPSMKYIEAASAARAWILENCEAEVERLASLKPPKQKALL